MYLFAIFHNLLTRTFVLLDGEHGQSIDNLVGSQRSTQGAAKDILQRVKNDGDPNLIYYINTMSTNTMSTYLIALRKIV